jgi:hypothetical protein
MARRGEAGRGRDVLLIAVAAWQGLARQGSARRGRDITVLARRGWAGLGRARQGEAGIFLLITNVVSFG